MSPNWRLFGVCSGLLLLPSFVAASAAAQTPPGATPRQSSSIEDVVVVARRVRERLQEVPISVTAITGAQLHQASIANGTDLIKVVPTLNVQQSSTMPGQNYAVRGIRTGVVTYFNDVPTPTLAVDDQIWDLGSIQALSGPQGTLFGENSTGGAILFVPQRPTDKFEGYVEGLYGNYDHREFTGVINIPVSSVLKIRIGGRLVDRAGVVKNILGSDQQSQHRGNMRASVLYDPTSYISNYTVFDYARRDEAPFAIITSDVNPNAGCFPFLGCFYGSQFPVLGHLQDQLGNRTIATSLPAKEQSREWGISDILTVRPYSNLTLRYIFGLRNETYDQFKTQTSINLPVQVGHNYLDYSRTFTNEAQAIVRAFGDRLNWTTGGFFSNHADSAGLSYQLFGQPGSPFLNATNTYQKENDFRDSKAVYSQATYKLFDKVDLTAGVRYTTETASIDLASFGPLYTFLGPEVCKLPAAAGVDLVDCRRSLTNTYSALTYNFSVDYHATKNTLLYVTTRRGFNAGGFNPSAPATSEPGSPRPAYAPEHITDYEAGVKSDWHLGSMPVRTNVALFLAKYEDIQRTVIGVDSLGVPFDGVETGPKATLYGTQIQALIKPTANLLLGVNYGYLHAAYDATVDGFQKGNQFAQAPKNTVGVNGSYTYPTRLGGDIVGTASYTYQSKVSFNDVSLGSLYAFQAGYSIVDLRLDWNNFIGKPVDIGVYVKNLTNTTYAIEKQDESSSFGFVSTIYNDPRTFGGNVRFRF